MAAMTDTGELLAESIAQQTKYGSPVANTLTQNRLLFYQTSHFEN